MTLIVDMATLEERCVQCGMPWIQHSTDDRGEYYCRDLTDSIVHLHREGDATCPILTYANWMRIMENPEEALP